MQIVDTIEIAIGIAIGSRLAFLSSEETFETRSR